MRGIERSGYRPIGRLLGAAVAVALLAGCATMQVVQSLTAACNTSASALRTATVLYKAGKVTETQARVVDNSAAVIDGFCRPGAPAPVDIASAAQAVAVAGSNIVALNLR